MHLPPTKQPKNSQYTNHPAGGATETESTAKTSTLGNVPLVRKLLMRVKVQDRQQGAATRAFTSGGGGRRTELFFGPRRRLAARLAHYRRCCFNSVRKKEPDAAAGKLAGRALLAIICQKLS